MRSLSVLASALGLSLLAGAPAKADFFTNEAAFLAALSPVPAPYTENFDRVIPGRGPGIGTLPFAGNGFAYTMTTPAIAERDPQMRPNGFYQSEAGGLNNSQFLSTLVSGQDITVTFTSNNVTAFGGYFYNTDTDESYLNFTNLLLINGGPPITLPASSSIAGKYFGFTSATPISSFTLQGTNFDYFNTIDNLTVGAADPAKLSVVPLPPTVALAGFAGLLGFVGVARRRLA